MREQQLATRNVRPNGKPVVLVDAVTITGVGQDVTVGRSGTLTVEVFGTATSFAVSIQAKLASGDPYTMTVTNMSGITNTQSITAAGIYQCDVSGIASVNADVTAISGGDVTVQGELSS